MRLRNRKDTSRDESEFAYLLAGIDKLEENIKASKGTDRYQDLVETFVELTVKMDNLENIVNPDAKKKKEPKKNNEIVQTIPVKRNVQRKK